MELGQALAVIFLGAAAVYVLNERRALFFPSPRGVLDAISKLARAGEGDLAVDLGAGDGRVCIELARRGARCVGVERDPLLLWLARRRISSSGVADRVTLVKGDLYKHDISRATVVVAFLSRTTTHRLRDKVLGEARPGARVVLVDHRFDGWEPERTLTSGRIPVRLYVVPPVRPR